MYEGQQICIQRSKAKLFLYPKAQVYIQSILAPTQNCAFYITFHDKFPKEMKP